MKMKNIILSVFFYVFITGCSNDWEPDFFIAKNVKEIRLTGLTEKPNIELTIGYYKTNNYKAKQMFKKYTTDTIDYFSPGIDITYLSYGDHNPPIYSHKYIFEDNVLTIIISYFDDRN
jgi:hypothetical protein